MSVSSSHYERFQHCKVVQILRWGEREILWQYFFIFGIFVGNFIFFGVFLQFADGGFGYLEGKLPSPRKKLEHLGEKALV